MPINREDPEVQELIAEVTAAMNSKNAELLRELKAAKAKAKGAEIDPEEHSRLQSAVEDLESKLQAATTKSKSEIEKLTKLAGEKDSALTQYLIDAELGSAIAKSRIEPHYVTAVMAMFKGQAQVQVGADGKHSVLIGDKPMSEHLAQWAAGDEGKFFVAATQNTGGGAAGGTKTAAGGAKKFSEMSTEERTTLYRNDPAAYEAAKKAG